LHFARVLPHVLWISLFFVLNRATSCCCLGAGRRFCSSRTSARRRRTSPVLLSYRREFCCSGHYRLSSRLDRSTRPPLPSPETNRLDCRCLRLGPMDSAAATAVRVESATPADSSRHRSPPTGSIESPPFFFSNLDWIRLGVVLGCDLVVRLGSSCRLGSCYSTHLSRLASVDSG
jgi:hypothetical protein